MIPLGISPSRRLVPHQILERIYFGGGDQPYVGVCETETQLVGEKVRVRARVTRARPKQVRVEYLDGPVTGLIVVQDGSRHWRYDPRLSAVHAWEHPESEDQRDLELLTENYLVKDEGKETVAGRSARVLSLMCRRTGKVAKRIWVDESTSVTLASEDFDCHGHFRSSSRLLEARFSPVPDTSVFLPPSGVTTSFAEEPASEPMERPALERRLGFAVKMPTGVSKRFRLRGLYLSRCPYGCGMVSAQMRYSDGLRSFSVFETVPCDCACVSRKVCAQDADLDEQTSCFVAEYGTGTMVSDTMGDVLVAVVGELPREDLLKIATSLR